MPRNLPGSPSEAPGKPPRPQIRPNSAKLFPICSSFLGSLQPNVQQRDKGRLPAQSGTYLKPIQNLFQTYTYLKAKIKFLK